MSFADFVKSYLTETPIDNFNLHGDWRPNAPKRGFTKKDIGILTSPKAEEKFKKSWNALPYDVDIHILRHANTKGLSQEGEFSAEKVREMFDWPEFKNNEDNITVIFINNSGNDKIPFTPWIAAHRFGHALKGSYFTTVNNHIWDLIEDTFIQMLTFVMEDYNLPIPEYFFDKNTKILRVLSKIGTMASARKNKISQPYEFIYEMFAQWVNSGRVVFNQKLEPVKYDHRIYRWRDSKEYNLSGYARTFEIYFGDLLSNSTGKIFVM